MVLHIILHRVEYYACEQCLHIYVDKTTAMECERWCIEKGTCNTNLLGDSVGIIRRLDDSVRISPRRARVRPIGLPAPGQQETAPEGKDREA